MFFPELLTYCQHLPDGFVLIPEDRKAKLNEIADYIRKKTGRNEKVQLNFICTHNSRRSQFGQAWAKAASVYFETGNLVETYSGGTEANAFNTNAVKALKKAGFGITASQQNSNPVYELTIAENLPAMKMFSKVFDDAENPADNFAAIMVCSQADEACPFVAGAEKRFSLPFSDPKNADGMPAQEAEYDKICHQIATELFYVFEHISLKQV